MKPIVVIALLVCSCATACNQETKTPDLGRRMVQPRLTGAEWQPCEGVECGRANEATNETCPPDIATHRDALQLLVSQPHCTESVIARLQDVARTDARARSDIAAAYYLRANRENGRETDLLQALDAADRAIAALPDDPAALYNLALIRETLGLREDAIAAWKKLLEVEREEWAKDAHESLARLQKPDAATQWALNQKQLGGALGRGDRLAVRKLIAGFPSSAVQYFEDHVVLPDQSAAAMQLLASELSLLLGGDPYFRDVAKTKGGPLYLASGIEKALDLARTKNSDEALQLLEALELAALERHYVHLLARIRSNRGYVLSRVGRHLEALAAYDRALAAFSHLGDVEKVASIARSRAGEYRTIGALEPAWHESLEAIRRLFETVDTRRRHVILGETAATAMALGYPRAALQFQDAGIRLIHKSLPQVPPENLDALRQLQKELGVAWRGRAGIALRLGRLDEARVNLDDAIRLTGLADNAENRDALHARTFEIEGQTLLALNPGQATEAFTMALQNLTGEKLRTFRASLYAQRAEAAFRAGRSSDAASDLEKALSELRDEEAVLLTNRKPGEGEELWAAYFFRFDETYDRLIQHFTEADEWNQAFRYSERARAFEPLDLILRLNTTPETFRKLLPDGQPLTLDRIGPQLPLGTFLLQYSVLKEQTLVWIVSRGGVISISLPASHTAIERWTDALQDAGRRRDLPRFELLTKIAYEGLLEKPLAEMAKLPGGATPKRLVIVPDGPMQGIPFAALYDSNAKQFLIQKVAIAIAGSSTLYIYSLLRDATMLAPRPSALFISDPGFDAKLGIADGMKQLPGAKGEVDDIRSLYAPNAAVLGDAAATVPAFLAAAPGKDIIHFAGHSIVNPRQPWHSVLLFAPSPGEPGTIDARQLLQRLKLDHTRLFVLSSCSSAGGSPVGPEGVAPLVRPLIAAGVPAVMGSLWDVDDATAKALSVSFHRHYRDGHDAAEALRLAQLDLLRSDDPGRKSALAWAPYQVIGHASSPWEPPHK